MAADTGGPDDFIRDNLKAEATYMRPDIRLYSAHPGSRLGRFGDDTPYWAYVWPGGAALAQHFLVRPNAVAGRTALDLGAGSGLVGIAAAKAGAGRVICSEILAAGRAAIALNAELNGVHVEIMGDITGDGVPAIDIIAAGDTFYDPDVAGRMSAFLRAAAGAGVEVLIGDIGRNFLPRSELEPIAPYPVKEFGDGVSAQLREATVYRLS